ncbi:MAG TPA: CehA/McbA family metallohydrolase [Anaerolineaceae bacterium]|nr:CehA/McbA family metallohydrolase [Anaerolineaceae bacterium]HOH19824.1 CehA/McbA family metallohydrolase [Anaerolineaceae bacterium]
MEELVANLHIHTRYSDGAATHRELQKIAFEAGLDVLITTDHNVYVEEMDGYFNAQKRKVLLLVGEEIHDPNRVPQKNHALVFGVNRSLAAFAPEPQSLIDQVNKAGGMAFLAHPYEDALPRFDEPDISWVDWGVTDFTGLELWNGSSEIKTASTNTLKAIFYALSPRHLAHHPHPLTIRKWDELTTSGKRVVAIGGSDAHALSARLGPLHAIIYPYPFHFQSINTHLLVANPLSGDLLTDRRMVWNALRDGHAFIGYDYPAPTRGFRFTAQTRDQNAIMGDEIILGGGVTFQVRLPEKTECRLIKDGAMIKTWKQQEICTYLTNQPGVYRVECHIHYLGKLRGWIYSNPIYVREP